MSDNPNLISQTVVIEGGALPDRERPPFSSVPPGGEIQPNQADRKTPASGGLVVVGVLVGLVVIAAVVKGLSK